MFVIAAGVCVCVRGRQRCGDVWAVSRRHAAVIKDDRFAVRGVRLYLATVCSDSSRPPRSPSVLLLPTSYSAFYYWSTTAARLM